MHAKVLRLKDAEIGNTKTRKGSCSFALVVQADVTGGAGGFQRQQNLNFVFFKYSSSSNF
jgi:hypothetical protein